MHLAIPTEKLTTEAFAAYLTANGWDITSDDPRRQIWRLTGSDVVDVRPVFLPKQRLADYDELMYMALERVSNATKIPREVLFCQIASGDAAAEFRAMYATELGIDESATAVSLLAALVGEDPAYDDTACGCVRCFYCESIVEYQEPPTHSPDCPWAAARRFLERP